jgi:hypothetical protein
MAHMMPNSKNMAPPAISPTMVGGSTGAWPGRMEVDITPVSAT